MPSPRELMNRSGAGGVGASKPSPGLNLAAAEATGKGDDKLDAKAKASKPKQSGGTIPNIGSGGGAGKAATGVRPKV